MNEQLDAQDEMYDLAFVSFEEIYTENKETENE